MPNNNRWKVDVREPESLITYFTEKHEAEISQLLVGDYVYGETVGFERKAEDFLDFPRMLRQAEELKSTYQWGFLLVEKDLGQLLTNANRIYNRDITNQIIGTIASLCVRGITPLFCSNQTILTMLLEKIAEKATDGKVRVPIAREIQNREYDRLTGVSVLMGIPGVGEDRAKEIMKLGTLREVLTIILNNPKELLKVKGIGKKTVESIEKALDDTNIVTESEALF